MIVVSDDLTGASDTAAQFAFKGCQTAVFLPEQIPKDDSKTWDVLSFCTDTRNSTGDEAYKSVAALLRSLPVDNRQIYKKIDSLLRGNVAREIEALLDVTGIHTAIVSPAFPTQHRTMIDGLMITPTEIIDAAKRFSNMNCPVVQIPLETVRQGSEAVAQVINSSALEGNNVFLADAAGEEDLAAIAQTPSLLSHKAVLCGSAGLAAHLSVLMQSSVMREEANPFIYHDTNPLPIMVVAGSKRHETARQITAALEHFGVSRVAISPGMLRSSTRANEISRCLCALKTSLQAGESVLFFVTSGLFSKVDHLPKAIKGQRSTETAVAEVMAEVVGDLLRRHKIGALFLTGGDTALHVCRALGAYAINIKGRLQPGIAIGRLMGGSADTLPVVTKSGAFGDDDTLVKAILGTKKFLGKTEQYHKLTDGSTKGRNA